MKTRLGNQFKQKKIMWVPRFFITELWVSSDITQNRPKPNRPLTSFSSCKIASNTKMTHIEFKFMWPNKNFRAWLIGGFFILFSKQCKNNFQKIELETSFQIIVFIFYMFGSHFSEQFSNTKNKNNCLVDHLNFWDFFKKKKIYIYIYIYTQKVTCRMCRLLFFFFFVDSDKGIELIMFFILFLMISFKIEMWEFFL